VGLGAEFTSATESCLVSAVDVDPSSASSSKALSSGFIELKTRQIKQFNTTGKYYTCPLLCEVKGG